MSKAAVSKSPSIQSAWLILIALPLKQRFIPERSHDQCSKR
jgi:hypothetical protein